ncbi:hypothetical protein PsorP6_018446 [Peronosclerospora sorghi]|nr:hypothetical protein PsorP6_018446 [Peronosclerospora sorghi]
MAPTAGTRLRFKNARTKRPPQTKKIPSYKNRIRALERFLSRGGLSDAARRAKKAELEELKEQQKIKDQVALEKKNVVKYKRPRFFERVKVMRRLRQTKKQLDQTGDATERLELETQLETYRQDMMYIYYFPRNEPYISLFPSMSHSEETQKRQNELRARAIAQFENEPSVDAFHQFCYNDHKSKTPSSSGTKRSVADLLLKKPTKEMVKKQHKKPRSKRERGEGKGKPPVALVDQDDEDASLPENVQSSRGKEEEQGNEQEADDFFL